MTPVFAEVAEIRADLPDRARFGERAFLDDLARRLESTEHLRHRPVVQAFLSDIATFTPGTRLTATKAHINNGADNEVFSLFNASYFPELSLDYLTYRTLPTDSHLAERYASPTMPVAITGRTEGFGSRVVVALFPENHVDGYQDADDMIFYFIDKFVKRHNDVTRVMIENVMAEGSFPRIQGASDEDIEQVSSWWVRLHEYHHRQGDMPIPDFLKAKSAKPLAGLEELRVDISGALACLNDHALNREQALAAREFILAERLLRYSVEGIPRPNYDAVASQLLFNYLQLNGGIAVLKGRIHLRPELDEVLTEFISEITAIEAGIHDTPLVQVRKELLGFTNEYTDFDEEKKDYRHIAFFADVKERLGV